VFNNVQINRDFNFDVFFAHYGITVESILLQLIQCLFTTYKLNSLSCPSIHMIDTSGDGVSYYFMETAILAAQKSSSDNRVSLNFIFS
jgi:hypothetical protein